MLNIHELQVFLVAAETENFSEAGRRLNISQPAVSMQIRSLETALGVTLFHRSGRHIMLSEAGQALVPMARELVNRSIQIEEAMASLQGEVVGLLKLGCSTAIGKYILPRLTARLLDRHPLVQVICQVTSRDLALAMLRDGEAHIAISSLREHHKDIEYRPFLADRIVLIARPDHPWAGQGVISPHDLLDAVFILREESSGTLQAFQDALTWHDLSIDHLKVAMVLGNSDAIRMAVQEGIGVAVVSQMVAAEGIQAGALVSIKIQGMDIHQTLYLARHTGRPATKAQTAFWDFAFAAENADLREIPGQAVASGWFQPNRG
jgi:DNA-binding transcriptional LysR family regulator